MKKNSIDIRNLKIIKINRIFIFFKNQLINYLIININL